jgi:hypothetical protein
MAHHPAYCDQSAVSRHLDHPPIQRGVLDPSPPSIVHCGETSDELACHPHVARRRKNISRWSDEFQYFFYLARGAQSTVIGGSTEAIGAHFSQQELGIL